MSSLQAGALSPGQAMIEFALVAGLLILVLLMGIQLAIIGEAALAANQLAYSTARYASVKYTDPGLTGNLVNDTNVAALVPPNLSTSSTILNISLSQACTAAAGSSSVFASVATVTVQYDLTASNKIFLPNPFLGISLPTTVSATQRAFCE